MLGRVAGTAHPSAFLPPNGMRPMGFRRAPGLAVTGRSDTPVRARSSSAHPTVRRNGNKEAIPLADLSASTSEHSQNGEQVDFFFLRLGQFHLLIFNN